MSDRSEEDIKQFKVEMSPCLLFLTLRLFYIPVFYLLSGL